MSTEPRSILHACLSTDYTVAESSIARHAQTQAGQGHTVGIIIRANAHKPRWKDESGLAHVISLPTWLPRILEGWAIGRIIKGFQPDELHSHGPAANAKSARAARRHKVLHRPN